MRNPEPQTMRTFAPPTALCLVALLAPASAHAFDYLEHSWFTDRACLEAQRRLGPAVRGGGTPLVARYLALSLTCPERWERPYCVDGYKQLEGGLNRLEEPPAESGDHPATLGDFAALPDHLSQFGPVRGFPRAEAAGLTETALGWLAVTGDIGGVIADVAEDACESDEPVPWASVERDVAGFLREAEARGALASPPAARLASVARVELPRGPHDPAGPYSFDNPHYLDLTRRNGDHFGPRAYSAFLGFHSAARAISGRPCADTLALDDDALEDLADELPGFEEIDWDDLEPEALRVRGCQLLAERARLRLLEWAARADPSLVEPVRAEIALLQTHPQEAKALLDAVASGLMALVFEGPGLHFLQDGQAAGHLRVVPQPHDLEASRFFHDTDGRAGVTASLGTRTGSTLFVGFGDGYLLGPELVRAEGCDTGLQPSREKNAACLLRRQRGLLVLTTTASMLDWAFGGLLEDGSSAMPSEGCPESDTPERFVCRYLPTRPPSPGTAEAGAPRTLAEGTLPVPAPPFSYESLLLSSSLDAAGDATQIGARLVFLNQLGARANWMTSYHLGLMSTSATKTEPSQLLLEFSHMFHWRWAARFLVNAGPFVYGGLRGFGESVSTFGGTGPSVGLSVLPEGWIKLPLEITFTYRVPVTLIDSRYGFAKKGIRVEAHWLELAVGLAFM